MNPFKIVERDGEPTQLGIAEGAPTLEPDQMQTEICVSNLEHLKGPVVMRVPGFWNPAPGTQIELHGPDREGKVLGSVICVDGDGITARVYVQDDETARASSRWLL